jgi:xanthine/uracil/vitamin C permease (AzgA family)
VNVTEVKPESAESGSRGIRWIRFDRNEWSGAFGDMGTDFPLIAGMILAAGLDPVGVLVAFGLMQISTGLLYRMPMPVQPLKAMAVLVIAHKATGNVLFGAGLAIAVMMLFLTITGLLGWLTKAIPKAVVRGIQAGLGLQLASLALRDYMPAEGAIGYVLAGASLIIILALLGNRRFPPAMFVIALGIIFAFIFSHGSVTWLHTLSLHLPTLHVPNRSDIWTGLIVLAIPQIALSLGNSVLATKQIAEDLFPEKKLGVQKIGLTYAAMNFVNPFLGGVPTCHGSGGMVGHYAFGGRTGGSVVIYGIFYLTLGLFASGAFQQVIVFFPKPMLGAILLVEAMTLISLVRDLFGDEFQGVVAMVVAVSAVNLPYGYVVGLVGGTGLFYFLRWKQERNKERVIRLGL